MKFRCTSDIKTSGSLQLDLFVAKIFADFHCKNEKASKRETVMELVGKMLLNEMQIQDA